MARAWLANSSAATGRVDRDRQHQEDQIFSEAIGKSVVGFALFPKVFRRPFQLAERCFDAGLAHRVYVQFPGFEGRLCRSEHHLPEFRKRVG